MKKLKKKIILFLINHFLSVTRFWKVKRALLRWAGFAIGENTSVVGPLHLSTEVTLVIGNDTWVGRDLRIEGNGAIRIGGDCDLGPSVTLLTGSHEIGGCSRRAGKGITGNVSIGDGCWIGAQALLLPGVEVANSSVIAAGAVVTKSVAPNVVVAGVPAKVIRVLEN